MVREAGKTDGGKPSPAPQGSINRPKLVQKKYSDNLKKNCVFPRIY